MTVNNEMTSNNKTEMDYDEAVAILDSVERGYPPGVVARAQGFLEGFEAGQRAMRERAASELKNWGSSYADRVRNIPITGAPDAQ